MGNAKQYDRRPKQKHDEVTKLLQQRHRWRVIGNFYNRKKDDRKDHRQNDAAYNEKP